MVMDHDKPISDRRAEADKYKQSLSAMDKKISEAAAHDIGAETMALVCRILDDNGVNDADLHNIDWWENSTEEADLWGFLVKVITKDSADNGEKKKRPFRD